MVEIPVKSKSKDPRVTEKSLANLKPKPWKKGQSGNPAGKAPGTKNRSTVLAELLGLTYKKKDKKSGKFKPEPHPLNPDKSEMTIEEALMAKLIQRGMDGSEKAIEMIQDTMFGKIKETKVLENPDGSALRMTSGLTAAEAAKQFNQRIAEMKKGKKK
jgi:hypothetical protein